MRRNAALAAPALVVLACILFLLVWASSTVVSIAACAAVIILTVVGCTWVLSDNGEPWPQHARDTSLPRREVLTATDEEMRVYWSGYMHDEEGNAYSDAFEYPNPPQYWLRAHRDEPARDDTTAG